MYNYTLFQWVLFFYFYCFFGWCFESAYVSICRKKLINRGFLRGPFLPLYGSGAIMMLVVSKPFKRCIPLVYLSGCVGATALEYVTGVVMEALFAVRYWDYSHKRFNYKGHICLSSTLAWGALTVLVTRYIHPAVEKMVLRIPDKAERAVTLLISTVIGGDFAQSFRAAIDLKEILHHLEKIGEEIEQLQKLADDMKDDMKKRLHSLQYHRERILSMKHLRRNHLLRNNPLTSKRFGKVLEELRERIK